MAESSDFVASSHQGKIVIERKNGEFRLEFSPSEATRASHIVGIVLAMAGLDNVPDHVKNTPFVVRIFPNRKYALERLDSSGSMPFRLHEGDNLIKVIKMGLDICLNEQTHGRVVPSNTVTPAQMVGDEPL